MDTLKQVLGDYKYLELVYENVEGIRVSRELVKGIYMSDIVKEYSYFENLFNKGKNKVEEFNTVDRFSLELDISQLEVDLTKIDDNSYSQELYDDFSEIEDKITDKDKRILSTEDDVNILKRVLTDLETTNLCEVSFIFEDRLEDVVEGRIISEEDKFTVSLPYNEGSVSHSNTDYINYNIKSELRDNGRRLYISADKFNDNRLN